MCVAVSFSQRAVSAPQPNSLSLGLGFDSLVHPRVVTQAGSVCMWLRKTRRTITTSGFNFWDTMPGSIRVSVLEAVDLPETLTDGTVGKDVIVLVILGPRLHKARPGIAAGGKIDSWNSDFSFPVLNLRDKLVVSICYNGDQSVPQTAAVIDIPSIIKKGSRDEFVKLEGGGRIHVRMSFVLTDEERKKIESMRLSTMKRREEERVLRTVVFRSVQPSYDDELRKPPVSTVTITDADVATNNEKKDLNGPSGFGSTTKPLTPMVTFDYAKAIGSQSCGSFQQRPIKTNIGDVHSDRRKVRGSAMDEGEMISSDSTGLDAFVSSPRRENSSVSSTKRACRESRERFPPMSQSPTSGGITVDTVKPGVEVPELNSSEGPGDLTESAVVRQKVKRSIENDGGRDVSEAGAATMASSHSEEFNTVEGQLETRLLNGLPRSRPVKAKGSRIEGHSGSWQRFDVRAGPEARWAHKTGLDTMWTSPKKARRIIGEECSGRVGDHSKGRAKIFEMLKAAGCSHESFADSRGLQELYGLAGSFGIVLNKVVGGAAMLLAVLFMMGPLVDGSAHGVDGLNGDDM